MTIVAGTLRPFPALGELARRAYDVIIVGGGINGAGIAREAALRGRSVLLLERHDFGWGTTWRSTKLIHGGLRYLEHAEFSLVFESLRDQRLLMREYPEMVRPLRLLLPIFRGDRHGPATIGLGLTLYDLLALGRELPRHRRLTARAAVNLAPGLRRAGLRAAYAYSDCQAAYPERLCLQTLQEARAAGAEAVTRASVTGLITEPDGRAGGVRALDEETGATFAIGASVVVNAAGPWVDAVLTELPQPPPRQLGGTKGTHLVVDYGGRGPTTAIYAEASADHRPFFIVPWRGKHLVGTTDTRFDGEPEDVRATEAEIAYLLDAASAILPRTPLSAANVEYAYAGVRPLPATDADSTAAITRRHIIRDHADHGRPGLISIIGGKLSTFRSLAAATMPHLDRYLPPATPANRAPLLPVPPSLLDHELALPPATLDYLRQLYGPSLTALLELLRSDEALCAPICEHGPDVRGQVVFAARWEGARALSDLLLRRTGVGWNACLGRHCAPAVATLVAPVLGWTGERQRAEVGAYEEEVRRTFTVPDDNVEARASCRNR